MVADSRRKPRHTDMGTLSNDRYYDAFDVTTLPYRNQD